MGTKLNPPKGWKRRMKKHGETVVKVGDMELEKLELELEPY